MVASSNDFFCESNEEFLQSQKKFLAQSEIEKGVLKRYRGHDSVIIIPNGVTSIGEKAFYDCKSLTSVIIPPSVTIIGELAFARCYMLRKVTIEGKSQLTSIKNGAFKDCSSLEGITIPNGVISIGEGAFNSCSSLENIEIPNSVISIGEHAFEYTALYKTAENWDSSGVLYIDNHLIKANSDIIWGTYHIRKGTKTIADYAFDECRSLECVIIDGNSELISIGKHAFWFCVKLTMNIPNSVALIGDSAFSECASLKSIVIPDGVKTIEDWTFNGCESLENIVIPQSVISIGKGVFDGCYSLKNVTMPIGFRGFMKSGLKMIFNSVGFHKINYKAIHFKFI